ncbi:RNA polymerase III RPC4-domain-containing protein [Trametes punicea]|nr:RNA polymerase III RPC4-domain-containing protein [Trametes punicea]
MSEQSSNSAGPSGSGSGSSSKSGGRGHPPKAIASLAKKQSDVTRLGTQKLKFVPTLPSRRVKEEVKKEEHPAPSTPASDRGRGRGRGADRGRGRGRGEGAGRGAAPRPPPVEMTASGPFAMGPALAGTSARRTAPRSNFAPVVPPGPGAGGAARLDLGAGLTQTTAPSLKREKAEGGTRKREEGKAEAEKTPEEDVYSDPDEGVEIIDMENVREMDWMAPEALRKERDLGKKKKGPKVKKDAKEEVKDKSLVTAGGAMDVDQQETPEEEQVNMANAVDLSESEDEEELEDIIDDFAQTQLQADEETDVRQECLYFFQFPHPFPTFQLPQSENAALRGKAKAGEPGGGGDNDAKKVTFAEDTKPPAPAATAVGAAPGTSASEAADQTSERPKVDGVVGQLEIYESGAVKLRMGNGIVMDVTAATQPSFLQHAVYVDTENKRLCVLGEVNRRFVVTPDIEALLTSMELADNPPAFELGEGLLTMDTT